ncbi:MAG: Maf family protein [Ktedonobacterales bacterium]
MPDKSRFPLYLASSSPRRRQLLAQANIAFELLASAVDEDTLTADFTGKPEELGQYLATAKALQARAVLVSQRKWGRILAADTTVLLDGRSLPKPHDLMIARSMLRELRGREHQVATGVALAELSGCVVAATSITRVLMRDYSDDEIETYVATGDSLDKAGGYSIQHPDFQPVKTIYGCHLGVIGLPMCVVDALLKNLPVPPPMSTCPWSTACTAERESGAVPGYSVHGPLPC